MADTRALVKLLFNLPDFEQYVPARGGKTKELPEEWITRIIAPHAHPDMLIES